jgi:hypothetical protein
MLCIKNRLFCWLFGNAFSRGFFVRGVAPGTWTAGAQAPHPRASTDPPNLHSSNGLQRAAMGAHSPAGPLATGVEISGLSHSASFEVVTSPSWAAKQNRQPRCSGPPSGGGPALFRLGAKFVHRVFEAVEAVMAPALAPTKPPAALVDVTGKLVEL